jgi:uncharacterized protein YjbI with pentapeptide repeats
MATIVIISVILFIFAIIWLLPKLQLSKHKTDQISQSDLIDLENKLRQTISQILGGVLLLSGIYFSYSENTNLKFKQNTETLSNSLKQLNDSVTAIRIGAIYTLNKLSINSEEDKDIITDIFANYISKNNRDSLNRNKEEIQLIFNLIGKGKFSNERIKIYNAHFSNLKISNLDFSKMTFIHCSFDSCDIWYTNFTESSLSESTFLNCGMLTCNFTNATIFGGSFKTTNLDGSDFTDAWLPSVYFNDCKLNSAIFRNTKFGNTVTMGNYNSHTLEDSITGTNQKTKIENSDIRFVKYLDKDSSQITLVNNTEKN